MFKKLGQYRRLRDQVQQRPPPQTPAEQQQQKVERQRLRQLRRRRLWPLLFGLVVLALVLLSSPTTAAASLPHPAGPVGVPHLGPQLSTLPQTQHRPASCSVNPSDWGDCLIQGITALLQNILSWLQTQWNNFLALGFMFYTPHQLTDTLQPVSDFYTWTESVVGLFLTGVLAISGYNYLTGRSITWTQTLPQVLFAAIIAFGFRPLIGMFIDISNDFIGNMLFQVGLQSLNLPTLGANGGQTGFMDTLAAIFYLLTGLLLSFEALARLALLDVLIVLAPLGLFCNALPQTRPWARMWGEAFAATLLIQPIQSVVVLLGSELLANVGVWFQVGFPPIAQVLVGIAMVYVALKVPGLLLSRTTHVASDFHSEIARLALYLAA